MSDPISVIVEQQQRPRLQWSVEALKPTYAETCKNDRLHQMWLKEKLINRCYARAGTLGVFMQLLGDFGRKYFPYIGAVRLRY